MEVELQTKLFIGNEFLDAADGSTFAVENPAEAKELAQVAEAKEADIDRACSSPSHPGCCSDWTEPA